MKQWGDMSQVFIGNVCARLPEGLDDSGDGSVFHTKIAFDTRLKQLALFIS